MRRNPMLPEFGSDDMLSRPFGVVKLEGIFKASGPVRYAARSTLNFGDELDFVCRCDSCQACKA